MVHIFHLGGKLRTGLVPKFLLGFLNADHIVLRVFLHSVDPEDIGIRNESLYLLDDHLVIAFRQVADASIHPVLSPTGVKCYQCLCHSRIGLTDTKVGRFSEWRVINFSGRIIVSAEIMRLQDQRPGNTVKLIDMFKTT